MRGMNPRQSFLIRCTVWLRAHAPELLMAALLLAVLPMRDLWTPDEPDFAQCVKEMRLRGDWLLPYLNGVPYSEKPILYYWVMKASAVTMDALTGGLGFTQGVAAWALRLPSVVVSVAFLSSFRRWVQRFMEPGLAEPAALVLATTPLWFWQSQFIQIDLLFTALLAWSWLCWLAGYLLLRGPNASGKGEEHRLWFLKAYVWLALAFLAKGPLAPVLSVLLLVAFLAWQRDFPVLRRAGLFAGLALIVLLVAPWYVAAGWRGGARYAYELIVFQNFERATKAWDHIHPWWKYGEYILGDFFPWVLLLPATLLHLRRGNRLTDPSRRFLLLAFLVPVVFLSLVQSKQGKYLLMAYPFLALLVADLFHQVDPARDRRLGGWLGGGLALLGAALTALALGVGGADLQAQLAPFQTPVRILAMVMISGTAYVLVQATRGRGARLIPGTAITLGLLYLLGGTWGFRLLDPMKSYRRWTAAVQPLIHGRQVFTWQTIRSGFMVYTDHLMPELRSAEALEHMDFEARLVARRGDWEQDAWGMTPALRAGYEVILSVPTGGDEILLLKKRPRSVSQEAP
ncbi:glycosyltransferase family 39 protein [Geothrix sp. PMB-07]|uniref:ArnT family glycosyltransferase n=1 Tax=Geothrix sp. PMB-07 TaxID=3068640 RepID=UPI0027416407|nr:glycosyltransferase family 39 protein [Geothrix sp. PMB-07]WLT33441.1 glycosyltransferase family 39 protein [Geothrix sp. PMB-07]